MTGTLCAHTKGSRIVTPAELEVLPAPVPQGPWHKPIPHFDVVTALHAEADRRSLEIVRQEWALAKNDQRLFGVIEFEGRHKVDGIENAWSFGIRNSIDCSIALQGVAGTRTFVCDNLALSGEAFVLSRKNTLHVHLGSIIRRAYDRYLREQERVDATWKVLAESPIDDDRAKAIILDAFVKENVAAVKYLPAVANEYFARKWHFGPANAITDEHPDTEPRTKAGLLGSFTRTFKEIKSNTVRWQATQKVGKVFGI